MIKHNSPPDKLIWQFIFLSLQTEIEYHISPSTWKRVKQGARWKYSNLFSVRWQNSGWHLLFQRLTTFCCEFLWYLRPDSNPENWCIKQEISDYRINLPSAKHFNSCGWKSHYYCYFYWIRWSKNKMFMKTLVTNFGLFATFSVRLKTLLLW